YLEDSFDRKEGVISRMFSNKPKSSILIKAVNQKSNPVANITLKLNSKKEREYAQTDHQGYARFGMLDEGDSFSVLEKQNNEEVILNDFVCDGRSEEHTSELQSRFDLVCRLLLEKKTRSAADGHRFTCRRWCCGTRVGY